MKGMKMKTNDKDMHRLVRKFMDGNTSLDEEQVLFRYFSAPGIAPDLLPLRDMFLGLQSLDKLGGEPLDEYGQTLSPHLKRLTRPRLWLTSIAASLLVGLVIAGGIFVDRSQNYAVAYFYGKKVTDRPAIRAEMTHTMKAMDIDGDNTVGSQLNEVLMTDN